MASAKASSTNVTFLVTGCGRSGTKYFASACVKGGIDCMHEGVFTSHREPSWPAVPTGESSWYALPFLSELPPDTPVVHLVRDPREVVASFYRIGMCSRSWMPHLTYGHGVPWIAKKALQNPAGLLQRIGFVRAHRRLLREHTSSLREHDEVTRLWRYWMEWNQMIENEAGRTKRPYLRLRLEDLDTSWESVAEFLGLESVPTPLPPQNTKPNYRSRELPTHSAPPLAQALAVRYGYCV